jgi:hypothetical protein
VHGCEFRQSTVMEAKELQALAVDKIADIVTVIVTHMFLNNIHQYRHQKIMGDFFESELVKLKSVYQCCQKQITIKKLVHGIKYRYDLVLQFLC